MKKNHLHSQFSPTSTVVDILGFMIWIGLDLIDQSKHAAIDRVLKDTFKLAINKHSRGISFETMPHLRSNKYNK